MKGVGSVPKPDAYRLVSISQIKENPHPLMRLYRYIVGFFLGSTLALSMTTIWADTGSGQRTLALVIGAFFDPRPLPALPDLTLAEALEVQDYLVMNLRPDYGAVAGYKRAQTAGADLVTALLLESMFTSTGSTLTVPAGVAIATELELLVRVGSGDLNQATNRAQAAATIAEVLPAVEVRDVALVLAQQHVAPAAAAVNGGARYLVLGAPLPIPLVEGARAWSGAFAAQLYDSTAALLASGAGLAEAEHPLDVVLRLKAALHARGRTLQAGDLLALGSLGPSVAPPPPGRLEAVFQTPFGNGRVIFALR